MLALRGTALLRRWRKEPEIDDLRLGRLSRDGAGLRCFGQAGIDLSAVQSFSRSSQALSPRLNAAEGIGLNTAIVIRFACVWR